MIEDVWYGMYQERLKGIIHPRAFRHPAKVSLSLAKRIYAHAIEEGWLAPGRHLCLDPMAGVATFGLVAAGMGIPWVGIELEDHFCQDATASIARHTRQWLSLGKPLPLLLQGDARFLRDIISSARLVVSSPPYADGCRQTGGVDLHPEHIQGGKNGHVLRDYAQPQAVISSPPFLDARQDTTPSRKGKTAPTQHDPEAWSPSGVSEGQIGLLRQDTYWAAMRDVYEACYGVLPPQGHIILVLKGFVRKREYVNLPKQTAQLLTHVGFTVVHWHKAMQTSQMAQLTLDGGEKRTRKASYFRRQAESRGAPVVDHEIVLCCVKE